MSLKFWPKWFFQQWQIFIVVQLIKPQVHNYNRFKFNSKVLQWLNKSTKISTSELLKLLEFIHTERNKSVERAYLSARLLRFSSSDITTATPNRSARRIFFSRSVTEPVEGETGGTAAFCSPFSTVSSFFVSSLVTTLGSEEGAEVDMAELGFEGIGVGVAAVVGGGASRVSLEVSSRISGCCESMRRVVGRMEELLR